MCDVSRCRAPPAVTYTWGSFNCRLCDLHNEKLFEMEGNIEANARKLVGVK